MVVQMENCHPAGMQTTDMSCFGARAAPLLCCCQVPQIPNRRLGVSTDKQLRAPELTTDVADAGFEVIVVT